MKNTSYWMETAKSQSFSEFTGDKRCDIAVIGAGLTGITTAVLLAKTGANVVVIEADSVGSGTTGNTTAKITVQHALKYQSLSEEKAQAYANANIAGLDQIAGFVQEYNINCDFKRLPSYVYTRNNDEVKIIEKEMRAYEMLGLKGERVSKTKLPFSIESAIVMDNQAQFHPLKYLYAMVDVLQQKDCEIYEHSKVLDIERGDMCVIRTDKGVLSAETVVLATNYPLVDLPGLFFVKLHQERSYIISTDAEKVDVKGMYINAGKSVNSIRMHYSNGEAQLILGGYGHKTAMEDDEKSGYSSLEDFLHADFQKASVLPTHRWAAQDCVPIDGMPYVGAVYKNRPNVYVATGYAKWGMTNSAAAAMMIADSIVGTNYIDEQTRAQFYPRRFTPGASAKNFFVQTKDTLKAYTSGNINIPVGDYADVAPGKGAVLHIGGVAQAVYKDKDGNVTAFKAHCTHLRCPLEYNEADNSFDCLCHGSRFSVDGQVLEGPAKQSLERIEEDIS